jgi:hypothetical protein
MEVVSGNRCQPFAGELVVDERFYLLSRIKKEGIGFNIAQRIDIIKAGNGIATHSLIAARAGLDALIGGAQLAGSININAVLPPNARIPDLQLSIDFAKCLNE